MKNPQRGEVWLVDLGMAAKVRPGLVVSVALEDQDRTLVTIVPHTTQSYGTRFEVGVKVRFLKEGVFDVQNLLSIPRAKFLKRLGVLAPDQLELIDSTLRLRLNL
jgi:mRNA interferase MazF